LAPDQATAGSHILIQNLPSRQKHKRWVKPLLI
jgi:hypothetical protein